MGFTVRKCSEKGFSDGVLRRGFPEGAKNAPLESMPPEACALVQLQPFFEGVLTHDPLGVLHFVSRCHHN